MTAVVVDDERKSLEYFVSLCKGHPLIDEAEGFTKPMDMLDWMDIHTADFALLDINMPQMNGIERQWR